MSLKNFSFLLLQKFQFRARRRDGSWLGSAAGAMAVESGSPSDSHDFCFFLQFIQKAKESHEFLPFWFIQIRNKNQLWQWQWSQVLLHPMTIVLNPSKRASLSYQSICLKLQDTPYKCPYFLCVQMSKIFCSQIHRYRAHVFAGTDQVFTRGSHNTSPGYVKRPDRFEHYDKRINSSSAWLVITF